MATESRREFLERAAMATAVVSLGGCMHSDRDHAGVEREKRRPPNVVLIITDDQGYGDLACLGNPVIQTPNIDRLYGEGVRFTRFHVSPVCSPTRSCLMTGRYNYRTGVVDTLQGRSMMYPDEVTLAEMLSAHGYRTGIFGKWHLGDNYPLRAMDQGFQESLVHKGGGICQPSEPRTNTYFDPILQKDGQEFQSRGYCTDVFTSAAIDFIERNASQPFFVYLPPNAPHEPLDIADAYWKPYAAKGVPEPTARLYGMVANIDENVGRVLETLKRLNLEQDTIVIFMTDNGPQRNDRFNAGMRGQKGSVYEGGIRVPCFIRWPGVCEPGRDIDRIAAHIDIAPTLLDACKVPKPQEVQFDGKSLLPLILDECADWPDRTLFFQWHRGDVPEAFKNAAVLTQRYKLVEGNELYDLEADPAESKDISGDHPDIVSTLRASYEAWFRDVSATRGYTPPRIILGSPNEFVSILTRQDWRNAESWHDGQCGCWEVTVAEKGLYRITAEFPERKSLVYAHFELNDQSKILPLAADAALCEFHSITIPAGDGRLKTWIEVDGKRVGPRTVRIERLPFL